MRHNKPTLVKVKDTISCLQRKESNIHNIISGRHLWTWRRIFCLSSFTSKEYVCYYQCNASTQKHL